jgi:hypothetical protein
LPGLAGGSIHKNESKIAAKVAFELVSFYFCLKPGKKKSNPDLNNKNYFAGQQFIPK